MLKNQIKIIFRNFWKHRIFSAINITGLGLGIGVCMVIYLYVQGELSYDKFHSQADRIYRVLRVGNLNGEKYLIGVTSGPFAEALNEDFSEDVEQTTRLYFGEGLVQHEGHSFLEKKFALADSNLLSFFSFPLALGDPATALQNPNSVLLTKETARKYFGDENPLNKIIKVDNEYDLLVTGVLEDLPAKSHIDFDLIGNLELIKHAPYFNDWWSNGYITYLMLRENASAQNLEGQLPAFMDKYFGEDFKSMSNRIDLRLQPLSDVYFQDDVRYDSVRHGSQSGVMAFSAIGIIIFIIACINFMNLATAKSVSRAREVGVRKALGASRKKLIIQFLGEALIIAFVSVVLAFTITEISIPWINQSYGLQIAITGQWHIIIPMLLTTVLITGVLAGTYPALVLSAFKPVEVLKGRMTSGNSGTWFRKILVVIQFTTSVCLIVMTLLISRQMDFMQKLELGFDKEQVLVFPLNSASVREHSEAFKNELKRNAHIVSIGSGTGVPGGFHDTMAAEIEGLSYIPRFRTLFADADYLSTFNLQVVAGRGFIRDHQADINRSVLLNEKAVEEIGLTTEEVLGKRVSIVFDSIPKTVVGVIKNYNFSSLKADIEPLIITNVPERSTVAIKIGGDVHETVQYIEKVWDKYAEGYPLEYEFIDDQYDELYKNEILQAGLFKTFAFIVIFISCMGILGLAAYTATKRLKEIGIRKTLGASIRDIIQLMVKDYVVLVVIANIVAWPVAWYFSRQWLDQFAYRVPIGIGVFIYTLIMAVVIAIGSVLLQSVRAALVNPVDILKEE